MIARARPNPGAVQFKGISFPALCPTTFVV